jgi:Zn ribbon nucleic-acid-binding protein
MDQKNSSVTVGQEQHESVVNYLHHAKKDRTKKRFMKGSMTPRTNNQTAKIITVFKYSYQQIREQMVKIQQEQQRFKEITTPKQMNHQSVPLEKMRTDTDKTLLRKERKKQDHVSESW